MSAEKTHTESRHPIGVVASRTGLPQDLIRAWERRYEAVTPGRGETGRRLYSDQDIEKLRLLRRALAGGRRISDVAALSIEALRGLVAGDREEPAAEILPANELPAPRTVSPEALLAEAIEALEALDRRGLERALAEASVQLSAPDVRQRIIVPLLDTIGRRWQDGSLRIVHEHLASTIVRSFMTASRNGHNREHAPRIVITTPAGQHHELGAMMAAAIADESGWDVYYLGANLPAEEIAAAVRQLGAHAIALSVVYRDGDHSGEEILRLRELVGDVPIFVGGRASDAFCSKLTHAGIACPPDLSAFRTELQSVLA
jgi:methanogenic corrinoid protein MtbC1